MSALLFQKETSENKMTEIGTRGTKVEGVEEVDMQ